ncbi:MAG: redoxin domain-containing protein [Bacteroidetes bacterium]|nr:redoxin domain-containing protein [Bacteroidota bacterium]MBS1940862.1 redoxin domain-containing protein [Bacteroidota bacterium]
MLLLAVMNSACTKPHTTIASLAGASWATADERSVELRSIMGAKATVIITLDPECPFCQLYAHDIQALAARFAGQGVAFIGAYTGPYMESNKAAAFAKEAGFSFPQLMDTDCRMALALKARVTPECFITDGAGTVVYRGAFDDRAVRQGRKKITAQVHYLENALVNFLRTGDQQDEVVAVGCIVECTE